MNDGKELVLDVGATAADFIEDYGTGAPNSRRRLDVLQTTVFARQGKAHQIIKIQKAGVVVAKLQTKGGGHTSQQQALGGAVRADEQ